MSKLKLNPIIPFIYQKISEAKLVVEKGNRSSSKDSIEKHSYLVN